MLYMKKHVLMILSMWITKKHHFCFPKESLKISLPIILIVQVNLIALDLQKLTGKHMNSPLANLHTE